METTQLMDPAFWTSDRPEAPGSAFEPSQCGIEGLGGLVFFQTSGSTGEPRWIGISREALLLSAAVVNRHLRVQGDCRWGLALPLHHVGGFGVVARAHEAGVGLSCFEGKWEASRFTTWLGTEGVSHVSLVPTQVHDLVVTGHRPPANLRAVVVGGGVLDEDTGRAARKLGWPVLASYGMTEAGSQVATQSLEVLERSYVTAPIPVLSHWKVDVEEDGRLSIRGPSLFSGELVKRNAKWRFVPRSGDGFETSDLGFLSEEGLTVTGRVDLQVKVLGELVDPVAVEAALGLPEVVVVPLPDERSGHRLVAVGDESMERSAVEERVADYNREVEGFLRIHEVVPIESIPRSSLGKPKRGELAQLLTFRGI
ncbi:MAG: AMP-binding protein [Verrucomicrobiota bacterium]